MKYITVLIIIGVVCMFGSCKSTITDLKYEDPDARVIFLHHSTGRHVWYGDVEQNKRFKTKTDTCLVPRLFKEYNEKTGKKINIEERYFPSGDPYPWKNYPYDYYNIWVKNAGSGPYMEEPTLEILTQEYDIIMVKHCFPVSRILAEDGNPDIDSEVKTIANYKLQYNALKNKMNGFPRTQFIVWTGAALVEAETNEEEAKRAIEFTNWVKEAWDVPGDNITLFDFREIETGGGFYLKPEYAVGSHDPHPNIFLSTRAAEMLVQKIIKVVETVD